MTKGDVAHMGFIDSTVYKKLKDKEKIMLDAIDGQLLVPEYTDDYRTESLDLDDHSNVPNQKTNSHHAVL